MRSTVLDPASVSGLMQSQTIALIVPFDKQGKLLLLKRNANQHCADLWPFPGGKVELGETAESAARRELKEETGLEGENWKLLGTHSFDYPDRQLHFLLFSCVCNNTQLLSCESAHVWADTNKLHEFPMPDANRELIQLLNKQLMLTNVTDKP